MTKSDTSLLNHPARLWTRFMRYLDTQNDQRIAAWGSSLQYKRRYTNPDDAKRARQPA